MSSRKEARDMSRDDLEPVFKNAVVVKNPEGKALGRGIPQSQLEEQGFSKSLLRRLEDRGMLRKMHCRTRQQGGVVCVWLLPDMEGGAHAGGA